ncbi:alpha/beta hydrolase family protein [Mangrovivirga cuniculi]|uniref:Dienelactone hydrolase n=1 Tax=Mangrovivirga cuniculi TaxID=2715131 RepID=A0A4D7JU27_9BACT|nr:dienelactone hydrolase family protein [Mangrovivirga cuniculi]QCK16122.1 dienelactone hydrolase [Mangrovivirga cuniculi]
MKSIKTLLLLLIFPLISLAQDFNVGERTIEYMDSSRNRPIKTEVWYPTFETDSLNEKKTELPFKLSPTIRNAKLVNKSFPLIVMSHGTGGNRFSLAWLAIELAKNGYIVIAPDHWGNTYDNKIPEYFVRYWERPLDINFLLTSILADKSINSSIDDTRIGMMGFSFGGYTTLAIAGADINCELIKEQTKTKAGKKEFKVSELGDLRKLISEINCSEPQKTFKDDRFKVFVAMAPALGLGLPDQSQNIKAPVLIIGAKNDRTTPIQTNAMKYHKLITGSEYFLLEGETGHYVFLNEGNKMLQKRAKRYYRDDKSVKRSLIHEQVTKEVLSFLKESF